MLSPYKILTCLLLVLIPVLSTILFIASPLLFAFLSSFLFLGAVFTDSLKKSIADKIKISEMEKSIPTQ